MLGRAKKTTKFEDSDSHMSRPRPVPELPNRPAPRVPLRLRTAAVVGSSEVSGAHHRAAGVGRGTPPRSPLHEKRQVGAAAGGGAATSRVAELEANLVKAQDQLTAMRQQLSAAEKARKDARAALLDARKRFGAVKNGGAAAADCNATAEQKRRAEAVYANGGGEIEEGRSMGSPSALITDVLDSENKSVQVEEAKKVISDDDVDEVNGIAVVADGDGENEKENREADELRTKLAAKDAEAYELRARLLVKEMEADEMRVKLAAKDGEVDELRKKLAAKGTEAAALEADNADLMRMAEETSVAASATAAKARELEHVLRESAAREARLAERLRASERAREALQAETQRARVQSEQWRKAAEEAAVVLDEVDHHRAGGASAEKSKRRHAAERTPSRDAEDGGKRKAGAAGGAIRMLSELWKKGQK